MIRVAICDDFVSDIETLKAHIARYEKENLLQIDVDSFNTEEQIISAIERAEEFDLLFVDIYMNSLNGIDLARRIRKNGVRSRIVFFSTSRERGVDAFSVNAIQYLVKPVEYDDFENAMKLALADKAQREETLIITRGNESVRIPLDEIVYIETQRNYQYVFLRDGTDERTRMTSSEIYNCLKDRSEFEKVGASYIVNLLFIRKIAPNEIILDGNKKIPVPRRVFAELEQKYNSFYEKGGR